MAKSTRTLIRKIDYPSKTHEALVKLVRTIQGMDRRSHLSALVNGLDFRFAEVIVGAIDPDGEHPTSPKPTPPRKRT